MTQFPDVQKAIPHRYPFLQVDRVAEFVPGERISGTKTITVNEAACGGHFPGMPAVPATLLIEMVTQLGAILVLERPGMKGKVAVILEIPRAHMLKPVQVGDIVDVEAEVMRIKENFGELRGRAKVGAEVVAEGQMRFAIADRGAVEDRISKIEG